eukprot:CAMPEP_0198315290 /NCGR_PEP_ID=MMETSP1450-20131203/5620_1 /TAXON_ID=753684 ORGANISM="Madagascaria erythrocladiodes, Strain CCMP3234" /NCGR_SAMPLE_ID=MMETSP1450 /ASSEMBLY_ACC=CAM_ASM_001115 /LENGTH=361 /DNA_ID=CAMNT_0044018399 /DNA_START=121 /DNA_END=1206 /DNA_ORIENTATION=+
MASFITSRLGFRKHTSSSPPAITSPVAVNQDQPDSAELDPAVFARPPRPPTTRNGDANDDFASRMRALSARRSQKGAALAPAARSAGEEAAVGEAMSDIGSAQEKESTTSSQDAAREMYLTRMESALNRRGASSSALVEDGVSGKCGMCGACGSQPPWAPEMRSSGTVCSSQGSDEGAKGVGVVRFLVPEENTQRAPRELGCSTLDPTRMTTKALFRTLSRSQKTKALEARRVEDGGNGAGQTLKSGNDMQVVFRRDSATSDYSDGPLSGNTNVFLLSYDGEEAAFRCNNCVSKFDRIKDLEQESKALDGALYARELMNKQALKKLRLRGRRGTEIKKLQSELESLEMTVEYLRKTLANLE